MSDKFAISKQSLLSLVLVIGALLTAVYISLYSSPVYKEQQFTYDIFTNDAGEQVYLYKGKQTLVGETIPYSSSPLRQAALDTAPPPNISQQWVSMPNGDIKLLKPAQHFGIFSLMPAIIAVALCLLLREPLIALLAGVVCGSFILGKYDILNGVLVPSLATSSTAAILLLYLWLLGGLMGLWAKTGAAQAFAETMTKHFVKGPRSAKFIAWLTGIIFFQGGTMSTVIVGTTVKPLADKANISHEEMAYIVDSTASPIACILAFNAWPAYVQALIFVPGVAFLATEADRINFFFSSIAFSFYAILAVFGTLLLSLNFLKFSGKPLRQAHQRALTTGQLDAPGAKPMSAKELTQTPVPSNYRASAYDFIVPLIILIVTSIATFVFLGSPKVNWAFGLALLSCALMAMAKGLKITDLVDGINQGLKGVVLASVILMLAVTIGSISKEIGAGLYMVDVLAGELPFWALPVLLQLITMVIAFSTGSSWGTYAITFPLAMPLAWALGQSYELANPEIYLMICFAAVLNGSVYGDQCSPISDTTILSSMTTGCDLTDHVKTQIIPATFAALTAGLLWTASTFVFAA
ncbi:sodium:proton antiporter [Psychrobium sp. MM17-31]|uniref:Na+/H+ antiporter NhaC family protein n=1 Tax=Psychrobium sp. MM17-31 TaxID=2917758 RepID=UPI001EF5A5AD|nr:Na+/H+ antiporter NhaC family protein [Psychrobium sp. MM17-31]MCG7532154.1 sodium:proton antiporter [Psychrobium sp. MM17-31]